MIAVLALLVVGSCKKDEAVGAEGIVDPVATLPAEPGPGVRLNRRLSHSAYDNTIEDLMGFESVWAESFAPDNVVDGWRNNADALVVGSLLADQYRLAAEGLAAEAVANHLERLVDCDPYVSGANYCARTFIIDFGLRAFRRPLLDDEVDRYHAIYTASEPEDGFDEAMGWVIAGLLQSPHFLYRSELGAPVDDRYALSEWEMASELSYLLWDTMPDDALFAAAADGELAADLDTHVERMLADPRASEIVPDFVQQWLALESLEYTPRDEMLYPELTPEIRVEMRMEMVRLVADVASTGGSLTDLLTASHTFHTDGLAAYYGMAPGVGAADAEGFRRQDLSGTGSEGLLSRGAVMTVYARPTGSSPVHRGLVVRERLLCQELPPPPPDVDTTPPAVDPSLTTREQYAMHASSPECAGCHQTIDPIGFAFEHFDGVGRWRDTEGGLTIDATGEIVQSASSDGSFDGSVALAAHLAASADVRECYLRMWTSYGYGVAHDPQIEAAVAAAWADDGAELPLDAPVRTLVSLEHFAVRRGEGGEREGPAASGTLPTRPVEDPTDAPTPRDPLDDLVLVWTQQDEWIGGFCWYGQVTNEGKVPVVWQVEDSLPGLPNNIWGATLTDLGGGVWQFSGDGPLAPWESVDFGLCGSL